MKRLIVQYLSIQQTIQIYIRLSGGVGVEHIAYGSSYCTCFNLRQSFCDLSSSIVLKLFL